MYSTDFKRVKWPKIVLNALAVFLSRLLIAVFVTLACAWMMGYKIIRINGFSMEPTIHYGNIIVVREVFTQDELEVGDIITFTRDGAAFVTHRIYSMAGEKIVTKGDPNRSTDPGYITLDNVVGEIVYNFNYLDNILGYFLNVIHLITLFLFVAALYQIYYFYRKLNPHRWLKKFDDIFVKLK